MPLRLLLLLACQSTSTKDTPATVASLPSLTQRTGQPLSQPYCGSWRQYPAPSLPDFPTFRPTAPIHANLMNDWRKPNAGIMLLENKLK